jgi:hypothetical protein
MGLIRIQMQRCETLVGLAMQCVGPLMEIIVGAGNLSMLVPCAVRHAM